MKTMVNRKANLVLLAIASLGISAYAAGDINITDMVERSKAKVQIEVPTHEDVTVYVTDDDGRRLLYDVIDKNSKYSKVFDFTQVDDGMYIFTTETGQATVTKTIELKDENIFVKNKEFLFKPIFKMEDDILMVHFLNQLDEEVSVSMKSTTRDYYEEAGYSEMVYDKSFDVKNLPAGEYTFTLASGNRVYYYNFRK